MGSPFSSPTSSQQPLTSQSTTPRKYQFKTGSPSTDENMTVARNAGAPLTEGTMMTRTAHDHTSSINILDLPAEIRMMIWRELDSDPGPDKVKEVKYWCYSNTPTECNHPVYLFQLLTTCRQTHDEVIPLLYRDVEFGFWYPSSDELNGVDVDTWFRNLIPDYSRLRYDQIDLAAVYVSSHPSHKHHFTTVMDRLHWGEGLASLRIVLDEEPGLDAADTEREPPICNEDMELPDLVELWPRIKLFPRRVDTWHLYGDLHSSRVKVLEEAEEKRVEAMKAAGTVDEKVKTKL
ncbi:hypothetical protein C1H76_4698 [Elsinoe australis]|uniref:Uncharacterized protein n=1 Tax=Elsinoe australis TaxID=40998 RepID=A0A4U7B265_9PEZI|nr:hypothetical protein C1H76_4698 [Elsinoe australis]